MGKSIAIIIARGGSKRIPRKNIRNFFGKPIIQYSIEAAKESCLFDKIMVSTDDPEIAEISKISGAEVPFMRSDANSSDFATTAEVLTEVLLRYENSGLSFEYCCCIYPTAPFVTGTKLIKAFDLLVNHNADSVIPVTRFSFPIWRSFKIEDDRISYIWPENVEKRSQDLPAAFHDCGQFYFFDVLRFLRTKKLVGESTYALETPGSEVQDIDCEEDWEIAEIKFSKMKNHK